MHFFNTYTQALSVYPGGVIKLNYLYDKDEIRFKNDHHSHLLWIFYMLPLDKETNDFNLVLIQVSWKIEEGIYELNLFQFASKEKMLFMEKEERISLFLNGCSPIWKEHIDNKFLLLFKIRELSYKLGKTVGLESLDKNLRKFILYNEDVIKKLEHGFKLILDYLKKEISIDNEINFNETYFVDKILLNPYISRLENWYYVFQFYTHQKQTSIWYESLEWIRNKLEEFRLNLLKQ